jgi:hypothetical protein
MLIWHAGIANDHDFHTTATSLTVRASHVSFGYIFQFDIHKTVSYLEKKRIYKLETVFKCHKSQVKNANIHAIKFGRYESEKSTKRVSLLNQTEHLSFQNIKKPNICLLIKRRNRK